MFLFFARASNICRGRKLFVRDAKNVFDFFQKHFASAKKCFPICSPLKQCRLVSRDFQGCTSYLGHAQTSLWRQNGGECICFPWNLSWFAQQGSKKTDLLPACLLTQETLWATMFPRLPRPLQLLYFSGSIQHPSIHARVLAVTDPRTAISFFFILYFHSISIYRRQLRCSWQCQPYCSEREHVSAQSDQTDQ